jgi:hypothetical protein
MYYEKSLGPQKDKEAQMIENRLTELGTILKCDKCDAQYKALLFLESAIEHGTILLNGPVSGYVGTLCTGEDCTRTLLWRVDRTLMKSVQNTLFKIGEPISPDHLKPLLRYDSFPYHFYAKRQGRRRHQFYYSTRLRTDKKTMEMYDASHLPQYHPGIEDLYSSYVLGSEASGPMLTIWWYSEDDIQGNVRFENDTGLRTFPRYREFCLPWEATQDLSFTYHLLEKLRRISTDPIPAMLDSWLDGVQTEVEKIPAFFKTLYKLPPIGDLVTHQFEGVKVQVQATSIDHTDDQLVQEVCSNFSKGYGRDFLDSACTSFIRRFIKRSIRKNFSKTHLRDLQMEYLQELDNQMSKEIQSESRYAFYKEGPTWTIIYNGRPLRGLKRKGLRYIHFLVCKKNQQFHTNELDLLEGVPTDYIASFEATPDFDNSALDTKGKKKVDYRDMVYGESLDKLKKERIKLQEELADAERENDSLRMKEAREDLRRFDEEAGKLLGIKGKTRKMKDRSKTTKNRIAKAIERALLEIQQYDNDTWLHFSNALKPVNSFQQAYRPAQDIEWHTK